MGRPPEREPEALAAAEDPADWHGPWEALTRQRYPGVALHQLQRLTHALEAAAMLLEQRRQRPLCPQGRPTPRARHVNAVFLRYGTGLQPAELERGLGPWLETTGKLWAQLQGARARSATSFERLSGSSGAWA